MNITIVGLGGVGGIVGGRLAAAAADVPELRVTFWCHNETLRNVRESGPGLAVFRRFCRFTTSCVVFRRNSAFGSVYRRYCRAAATGQLW